MKLFDSIVKVGLICALASHASAQSCPKLSFSMSGDETSLGHFFGTSIAVSSRSVYVLSENASNLYEFDLQTEDQSQSISFPSSLYPRVDHSMASDGNLLMVGTALADWPGSGLGEVRVLDVSGSVELKHVLYPIEPSNDFYYGRSIDLDSTLAIIGNPGETIVHQRDGAAHLVDLRNGETIRKLVPSDPVERTYFGNGVAISGTTALVTKRNRSESLAEASGAAYLFDVLTGEELCKLLPSDLEVEDNFASAFALDGRVAIVGAPKDSEIEQSTGVAYVFNDDGKLLGKLRASDAEPFDLFGSSVAIDGTNVLIGAPGDDTNGANSGAVYVFDLLTFEQVSKITPTDGHEGDRFGASVDILGLRVAIGAPGSDESGFNSGKSYIYKMEFSVCSADMNLDCLVNQDDAGVFIDAYQHNQDLADINKDGSLNFIDISEFLAAFAGGCS